MGVLRVRVSLHDQVIEDRILRVWGAVRLGEAPDARVAFPGADLTVVRLGTVLAVRGRNLIEGEVLSLFLGPVRVDLEHVGATRSRRSGWEHVDVPFLVLALGIMVLGLWGEVLRGVLVERAPDLAATQMFVRLIGP